jgi:hypothetical protein
MPRWIGRLLWSMRGKRRVTLQIMKPGDRDELTMEGILIGRWAGHYVLEVAKIIESPDKSVTLDARYVEVPADRVIFVEVHR